MHISIDFLKRITRSVFIISLLLLANCKKNDPSKLNSLNGTGLKITAPNHLESFYEGDVIKFEAALTGETDKDFSKVKVIWRSDKDGLLKQSLGLTDLKLEVSNLSLDEHTISIELINEVDSIKKASVRIRKAVKLGPLTKTDNSINLNWGRYKTANFSSYKIVRYYYSEIDTIATLKNSRDTLFVDNTVTLDVEYRYQVVVSRTGGAALVSNTQSMVAGTSIKVDYPISKIIKDPLRDLAYGIITPGRYGYNPTLYGLAIINTKDFKIEKRILNDIRISDISLSLDGKFIYLCDGSNSIFKVDIVTYEVVETINTIYTSHKIEVGKNNRLYFHITPPTSGSTEFRMVDLEKKVELPYRDLMNDAFQSFSHGDFDLDTETNTLFHGEDNISSPNLTKLSTTDDVFKIEKSLEAGGDGSTMIFNKPTNRVFFRSRVYNSDLELLGQFIDKKQEVRMQAVSPDGSLALCYTNLFDAKTFTKVGSIRAVFDIPAFLNNNSLLLCHNTEPTYQKYECTIYKYSF
ncbi:MAG: hypothetical protein JWQ25_2607 [Daejeonella sp.]|nr:hypothetical protein [Daejeonella sp.]